MMGREAETDVTRQQRAVQKGFGQGQAVDRRWPDGETCRGRGEIPRVANRSESKMRLDRFTHVVHRYTNKNNTASDDDFTRLH
jgi:hypothetical protein